MCSFVVVRVFVVFKKSKTFTPKKSNSMLLKEVIARVPSKDTKLEKIDFQKKRNYYYKLLLL